MQEDEIYPNIDEAFKTHGLAAIIKQKELFNEYMEFGGFPEVTITKDYETKRLILKIKSVHTENISQTIIDQIKSAIFEKKIKPGEKLPSERQLMEQFQCSRVTVREALKALEYPGILEIRRGTQGGAYVVDPYDQVRTQFVAGYVFPGKYQDLRSHGGQGSHRTSHRQARLRKGSRRRCSSS